MSDTTVHLGLPLLAAGQSQKHVTLNEALTEIDDVVQLSVRSSSVSAPPAAPLAGDRYIVPAGASGGWSGQPGRIAVFRDNDWRFLDPRIGWRAWVEDEALLVVRKPGVWVVASPVRSERLGLGTDADLMNRLAVASPGSLFTHEGGSHRLKINKSNASETASVLLQAGFSGRAELGLAGDDDLHVKVSPDGSNWQEALWISRQTGRVSFPGGVTGRNVDLAVNGDFAVNQRGFPGGALAAGVYGFDRWRAAATGATITRTGSMVTLSAGGIVQPLDAELWGEASFANKSLAISVEDLSGGSLEIAIGSASQVLAPGPGRRSISLTVPSNVGSVAHLTLKAVGSGATFRRVKAETGTTHTDWEPRPASVEAMLCRRYFMRMGGESAYQFFGLGYIANSTLAYILLKPPQMRTTPVLEVSAPGDLAIASGAAFVPCSSIYAAAAGLDSFLLGAQVAGGLTTGFAAGLQAYNSLNARISLSAEL